jgi:hypothetical protein
MSNPAFETESIDLNDNPLPITDYLPKQNLKQKDDANSDPKK